METPRIKPEEQKKLCSQVQARSQFVAKLVPFVDQTDARNAPSLRPRLVIQPQNTVTL